MPFTQRVGAYVGMGSFKDAAKYYSCAAGVAGQFVGTVTMSNVIVVKCNALQTGLVQGAIWARTNLIAGDGAWFWQHLIATQGISWQVVNGAGALVGSPTVIPDIGQLLILGATHDGANLRLYTPAGEVLPAVACVGVTPASGARGTTIGVRASGDIRAANGIAFVLGQHREDLTMTGANMLLHLQGLADDLRNNRPLRDMPGQQWCWNAEDADATWVDRVAGVSLARTGMPERKHVLGGA